MQNVLFIEPVFGRYLTYGQVHQLVVFIIRPVLEGETWPQFLSTQQCLHATGSKLEGDGIATPDVYYLHHRSPRGLGGRLKFQDFEFLDLKTQLLFTLLKNAQDNVS